MHVMLLELRRWRDTRTSMVSAKRLWNMQCARNTSLVMLGMSFWRTNVAEGMEKHRVAMIGGDSTYGRIGLRSST